MKASRLFAQKKNGKEKKKKKKEKGKKIEKKSEKPRWRRWGTGMLPMANASETITEKERKEATVES